MADVVESGIDAAAEAFKRMHGNVCYPSASDGEAKWAAEEIVKAYLGRARLSQAGAGGAVVKPLEFRKPPEGDFLSRVETILGTARVWTHHEANGMWFWKLGDIASGTEANEAACKTMLWLTYQDRILSTLSASPSVAEPVAWRWREKGRSEWKITADLPVKSNDEWDIEPLYATPPAPVPTASVEAGANLAAAVEDYLKHTFHADLDDALETFRALTPAPTQGDGEPNFCESCAMDLATCDCVNPKPVRVYLGLRQTDPAALVAECSIYLKPGETPKQRMDRDFADAKALFELLAKERERTSTMIDALTECEEYFDNRADADCDQDSFVPNKEMRLLSAVRDAIAARTTPSSPVSAPSPAGGVREAAERIIAEASMVCHQAGYHDLGKALDEIVAPALSPATPEPVALDPLNGGCPHCKWLDTNLGRVLDQKCALHQKIEDMQSNSALDQSIIKEQAGLSLVIGGLYSFFAAAPGVLMNELGLSAVQLGLSFAATVVIVFLAGFLAPRLAHRSGPRAISMIGLLIALAGGGAMFAFAAAPTFAAFTMAIALYLFGMGLINPLSTAIALSPFGQQAGVASALLGFMQMGCAAIGASFASTLPFSSSVSLAVILTAGSTLALLAFLPVALRQPRSEPEDVHANPTSRKR